MDSLSIKNFATTLGADLCGIASFDRFAEYRLPEAFQNYRSAIVFAKRMPAELLVEDSHIRYSEINNRISRETDDLAAGIAYQLANEKIHAEPILFNGPNGLTPEASAFPMKQAGFLAGLGVIGKNSLLMNRKFGNMIRIGAVLTELELAGDPLVDYQGCPSDCRLCIEACPQRALDGMNVDPARCRPVITSGNSEGRHLKKCSICRRVCPNSLGIEKGYHESI